MMYPMGQWDPFEALERLFSSMWDPRFFGSPWAVFPALPRMNVEQRAEEMVLRVAVPGISPEDLSVTVNDNVLTVRAIRRSVSPMGRDETSASGVMSFERSFTLPSDVDTNRIKARYHQGVLEIRIPRSQGPSGREIPIDLE